MKQKTDTARTGAPHTDPIGYVYAVTGGTGKRAYEGRVSLVVEGRSGRVTGVRVGGAGRSGRARPGAGVLRGGRLEVRFGPPTAPPRKGRGLVSGRRMKDGRGRAPESMTHAFRASGRAEGTVVTGAFEPGRKKLTMLVRAAGGESVEETWTLERREGLIQRVKRKLGVKPGSWTSIEVPVEEARLVKVSVPGAVAPRGLFLPDGEFPPDLESHAGGELYCVPARSSRERLPGEPDAFVEDEGPVWVRKLDGDDLRRRWLFWFRDDAMEVRPRQEISFSIGPVLPASLPGFCDPFVTVEVYPHVVAPGQEVTITVRAAALAGLDMFWWFGNGTGVSALDKAHIMAGSGALVASHTWTVTLDDPGLYTFGANARDLVYWNNPTPGDGVAHQASEGCGLAWDTVEVRAALRRSYNVGFVVLAPDGTDVSSPSFQQQLTKLDDIKAALPDQFSTSTVGKGACDASHPTMVLTPPGQAYGTSDGGAMYTFVRDTVHDHLYPDHPDIFDFLAVYEAYPDVSIGGRHLTVRTRVAGLGKSPSDHTASWGSAGKLRGVGLITDVADLPTSYAFRASKMHLLLHEVFGHQWGVFTQVLMRPGFHFDIGMEAPTFSVLYANPWRKVDATHFTMEDVQDPDTGDFKVTFHPWMLYLAGMLERSEVPETLMLVSPDTPPAHRYDLVTTTGTSQEVSLQSVIDQSGDRYDL